MATSSIDLYESNTIHEWKPSLLVVSLKLGRVLRLKLDADFTRVTDPPVPLFSTQNRYRDLAMHPDGRTFYIITDSHGATSGPSGGDTTKLLNPGAIIKFVFSG